MGPSSGARLYYDLSQMIVVRGSLGVRVVRSLGAVCLADGISGAVWFGLVAACSLINFCLCVMMHKSLVCAKEQILLKRVFAIFLSWRRATELASGVLCPFRLRSEAMEGRTLARADAKSFAVPMRVVLAWLMEMQTNSTRPQYFRRAVRRGRYLSVFSVYF